MTVQPPATITCPVCSNVNPWSQDVCLSDAFDLRPIKQQIAGAASAGMSPPRTASRSNGTARASATAP